jgi:hypothetical protein
LSLSTKLFIVVCWLFTTPLKKSICSYKWAMDDEIIGVPGGNGGRLGVFGLGVTGGLGVMNEILCGLMPEMKWGGRTLLT